MAGHNIFISYRRRDAGGHAGRLHEYLSRRFGDDRVFFDRSTIKSGDVFPDKLRWGVEGCAALLALITPEWLDVRGNDGCRRLDDADDFVRREIALALEQGKKVIPVLFDDTPVPPRDQLPDPLKPLASCHALTLRGETYEYQTRELVQLLAKVPGVPQPLPEAGMTEQFPESVAKAIGHLIMMALGALLAWLIAGSTCVGSALVPLLSFLGGVCGGVFSVFYQRYVGVLGAGAQRKGSLERQAYDALRGSLLEGGSAARLYARRLTRFLDAVDRFFGDAGMANKTLFPRAFGLRTPASLWTAPAFDRCLHLALIYPIVMIFVIWVISGHVGSAEAALHLKPDLWQRGLAAALVGFPIFAGRRAMRREGWRKFLAWLAVALVAVAAVSVVASAAVGAAVVAFTVAVAGTGVGGRVGALTVAVAGGVLAGAGAVAIVASAGVGALAVLFVAGIAIKQGWQGVFLALFLPAMFLACLVSANLLSPLERWELAGPMLLIVGLLTLVNAPFDWASLGLTRALLRRGLELAGWWPYLLALVDALFAAVIVALLAVAMVIGVQAYDGLAAHGGGAPVLPLDPLFNGIAAHPTAPEYWWIYALLLSTMIPSLINLVIGGASLVCGIPGLATLLLWKMPAGRAVFTFDRAWIAYVLTAQWFLGAILGFGAQAFLVVGIIGYVMPWCGLGLLDMARDVAALNLPARSWQLLGDILQLAPFS